VIIAELPGVERSDLTISMHDDGRVTFAGVRRERAGDEYHRVERGHGTFSRTFHLPIPVHGDRITADLRDGVLTVTCPKAPEGGGRRIHITS
jgi:HSP20 family protein